MTYMTKTPRARAQAMPVRRKGLSGWFEDLLEQSGAAAKLPRPPSDNAICLDAANKQVAPLDARIDDLSKNWRPTGFYTPDQIMTIVDEGNKLGIAANDAVRAAPLSAADASSVKGMAIKSVQRKIDEGRKYADAAHAARTKGIKVVNAPGLRDWAIGMMRAASDSLVTAAVLDCHMPWLATMIIKFQVLFNSAAGVFKRVVGVIAAVGDTVLNVAGDLPQIWTVVKWGGIAAITVAVAIKLGQMRRNARGS